MGERKSNQMNLLRETIKNFRQSIPEMLIYKNMFTTEDTYLLSDSDIIMISELTIDNCCLETILICKHIISTKKCYPHWILSEIEKNYIYNLNCFGYQYSYVDENGNMRRCLYTAVI